MKEFDFIKSVNSKAKIKNPGIIKGIGDDCAVIDNPGKVFTVLTTDALYEDTHFSKKTYKPWEIGAKAIAVNISDICAMGGTPKFVLVNIGFNKRYTDKYINEVYKGVIEYTDNYGIDIIGGDTVKSDKLFLSITMAGEVSKKKIMYRSGAKTGDSIFVTGFLGDSFAGYSVLKKKTKSKISAIEYWAVRKQILPIPKYAEGKLLADSGFVNSCMDISDGLVSDISRIMSESKKGAELNTDYLPVSYSAAKIASDNEECVEDYALYGGEDYELLFTVSKANKSKLVNYMQKFGMPVFEVGKITSGKDLYIIRDGKKEKESYKQIWKHF